MHRQKKPPVKWFALVVFGLLMYYGTSLKPQDMNYFNKLSLGMSKEFIAGLKDGRVFSNVSAALASSGSIFAPPDDTAGLNRQIPTWVIPGGQAFGVKIFSQGVMVVGISQINTADGEKSPAYAAGIRVKDIITHANGKEVNSSEEIADIFQNSNGAEITLSISRKGSELTASLYPERCVDDNKFKVGMWIRDSSAGIGTVTFIEPVSRQFGGLGHAICDVDTGEIIPILEGNVVGAEIVDVKIGEKGYPGELIGIFNEKSNIGTLFSNTNAGVFGSVLPEFAIEGEPIEVGLKEDIKEGDAEIICSADGAPRRYRIKITKLTKNNLSAARNMNIEVVDPELLALTGGIVQGMSGSPIIQNGKIIGAVTHVLINDPTKGYGIFIENMLTRLQ